MDENHKVNSLLADMKSNEVMFSYCGEFSFAAINNILCYAKEDMISRNIERRVYKRVYAVLVECLENILKHGLVKGDALNDTTEGALVVCKNERGYQIKTGNFIQNSEISQLMEKIEKVMSFSLTMLKEEYEYQLLNGSVSDRGGAGLGLLDLAIKSNQSISYSFEAMDTEHSFFLMEINIK